MKLNVFLAIGIVGLIATLLTEVTAGLLASAFGPHPFRAWLPYYAVWIVFTVLGVVIGKSAPQQDK